MKKLLLTAAAVFAFGFANAQDVKFGVKAGLNLGTLTGDLENAFVNSDMKMRTSFNAGGFAEIKLSDKFAIQPEILYSVEGGKQDVSGESEKLIWDLAYVNIPVMAKFYPIEKLSIEAGPQIGFLTKAEATFDGETVADFKDDSKSTAISLNLGAGYDFTKNIFGSIRYNLGMTNIIDENDFDSKSNVLSLSVGYKF
ncbi:porin family protein [Flavobacterium luminosum]|uniref:PorT family protein n=1 Tax=Flavobacterium luminosum TaxID=2949086 RepID=A0ABT0TJZ7_9FLAO|nr:porin family protein [Flavobacterium sp. HXWNR70]MCL9807829.1 PorT family protein [Flavobacterium sp. HXWNR70]